MLLKISYLYASISLYVGENCTCKTQKNNKGQPLRFLACGINYLKLVYYSHIIHRKEVGSPTMQKEQNCC